MTCTCCVSDLAVSGSTYGELGMKVDIQGGFAVSGGVKPGCAAILTIEVAVDIFIARIGIGGELTIVDAGGPAVAMWKPSNSGNPFGINLGVSIGLLGGRLYAFIELGETACISWTCFCTILMNVFVCRLLDLLLHSSSTPPLCFSSAASYNVACVHARTGFFKQHIF